MKNPGKAVIGGLIIGLTLAVLLASHSFFPGPGDKKCMEPNIAGFTINSKDLNRSHMVNITFFNASGVLLAEEYHELNPGDITSTTFRPHEQGDMNYSVVFIVDGKTSSHFEQIVISSGCSESFDLDPPNGIIRSYQLWCGRTGCEP